MLLGCVVKILSSRSSSCEEAKSGLIPNSFCLTVSLLIASPMVQTIKNLPAMSGTWVQPLGQEDPLGKGMTTLSSTLAWRIPWTEEPGGVTNKGPRKERKGTSD